MCSFFISTREIAGVSQALTIVSRIFFRNSLRYYSEYVFHGIWIRFPQISGLRVQNSGFRTLPNNYSRIWRINPDFLCPEFRIFCVQISGFFFVLTSGFWSPDFRIWCCTSALYFDIKKCPPVSGQIKNP